MLIARDRGWVVFTLIRNIKQIVFSQKSITLKQWEIANKNRFVKTIYWKRLERDQSFSISKAFDGFCLRFCVTVFVWWNVSYTTRDFRSRNSEFSIFQFCDFSLTQFFNPTIIRFVNHVANVYRVRRIASTSICAKKKNKENNECVTGANTIYYYCTGMHACWPSAEDVKTERTFSQRFYDASDRIVRRHIYVKRITVSTWSRS